MSYKTLQFECREHIGWLTLNRPDRLNALSREMVHELRHFFFSLEEDLDVRVVVIRGAGRAFCAGLDLKESFGAESEPEAEASGQTRFRPRGFSVQRAFSDIPFQMRQAPQPIISAVRGPAVGGGFAIAMASDIRIAAESARFNVQYTRVGMSAGDIGSSYFLPRLIGLSRAAEYMYTSRWMDAAAAERFGLVSRVVPDDELERAASDLAGEMMTATPFGLRMTKEALNINIDAPSLLAATGLENRNQMLCAQTEDQKEAVRAFFFEKRSPSYNDR